MLLEKELENWAKDETKYITKFYLIMKKEEKKNIELYYKFEKDDEKIERKAKLGVDLKHDLSKERLDRFLGNINDKFHKLIADHIEENWEQDIFTETPNHLDDFDIAYYPPLTEESQEGIKPTAKVIITDGKRIGNEIVSIDGEVNFQAKRDTIRIIGWSHK